MPKTSRVLLLLACVCIPTVALANSLLPAPLIWLGLFMEPESIVRYVACVALGCLGIEAAIYKYLPQFEHPYRDTLIANLVSTALGIPAAAAGALAGDFFIFATLLTICSECLVIYGLERPSRLKHRKPIVWPVVIANVTSNALIVAVMVWKTT